MYSSNIINIYGINSFANNLKLENNTLIINNYNFSANNLFSNILIYGLSSGFNLLDKNKNLITSETIKTGNYIEILINSAKTNLFQICVLGDVNSDGKISALDYVRIKNHIMGTNKIEDDLQAIASDLNEDNKISALDYVRIKNYIMNFGG